jgi:hypothetical protein
MELTIKDMEQKELQMNINKEKSNLVCHVITDNADEEFYWFNDGTVTIYTYLELIATGYNFSTATRKYVRSEFEKSDDWSREIFADLVQYYNDELVPESFDSSKCVGVWVLNEK